MFVVERDTPLRELADARERIRLTGTPIVGYVFNRADFKFDRYYTYYPSGKPYSRTPRRSSLRPAAWRTAWRTARRRAIRFA